MNAGDEAAANRAKWQETAFGGELAGMIFAARGDYQGGGGWDLYLGRTDSAGTARLVTWPPHPGYGGSVSLGFFGSTDSLNTWSATGFSRDRSRAHRAFAVSAVQGAARVVVTDSEGKHLELTHAATHPDGRTQLFVGGSTALASRRCTEAFDSEGRQLVREENPHPDRS